MRTIGIIGAMEEEISFLREKMDIVTTKSVVGLTYVTKGITWYWSKAASAKSTPQSAHRQ